MKLMLPHETRNSWNSCYLMKICQICSCIMGTVYSWNSNNVVGLVSLMKLVLHHGTRCPWDLALMEPCYIMKPVLHYETLVAQRDLLSMGHVSHYAATHETRVTHENSLPRVTSCSCPRVLVLPLIDSFDLCSIVLRPTLDFSQQKVQTIQGKLLIPFQRVMSLSSEPQNLRKKQLKIYSPFLKKIA